MKTFLEFLEEAKSREGDEPPAITFGKKKTKEIKTGAQEIATRVKKDIGRQRKENPKTPTVANFNRVDPNTGQEMYSKPGSVQRQKEIEAMLQLTREWKKKQK